MRNRLYILSSVVLFSADKSVYLQDYILLLVICLQIGTKINKFHGNIYRLRSFDDIKGHLKLNAYGILFAK